MKHLAKSILVLALALALTVTAAAAADGYYTDSSGTDVPYRDFFDVDYPYDMLKPGQTYYFPCEWSNGPMNDKFFDEYVVSISVNSPYSSSQSSLPEYISTYEAKRRVDAAEFVKNSDGSYYFKFKASNSYSYVNDTSVLVIITARDKRDSDYRGQFIMELEIGYAQNSGNPNRVDTSTYEVDPDSPILQFDEDLDSCRLDFEDGSYYHIRLTSRTSTFGFAYNNDVNPAIQGANPKAKLHFLSFPSGPRPAYEGLLKMYAPGARYLYEIGDNNQLTLVSTETGVSDHIGLTTKRLASYVASDIALTSATSVSPAPQTPASPASPASTASQTAMLESIMRTYFKNQCIVLAYGQTHSALPAAVTLKSKPDLSNMSGSLFAYAYDAATNRLIRLVGSNAHIKTDGFLYFNTSFAGLHVISSGALAAS